MEDLGYKYKYGLIDMQYFLFRNRFAQQSHAEDGIVDSTRLMLVNLQTVMKLKRDYEFAYAILLWDSKPYFKEDVLHEYKADRFHPTESDLDKNYAVMTNESSTEEDKKAAAEEIHRINVEIANYNTQQEVKFTMIDQLGPTGFKSVIRQGFEADDLAYLSAKYISEHGETAVLLTADTDWVNFIQPGVEFISTKNYSKYEEENEAYLSFSEKVPNVDRHTYGILKEIYYGGHNNVPYYNFDVSFEEFSAKLVSGDTTLPEYDIRRQFLTAMDVNQYWELVDNLIIDTLNDHKADPSCMNKFMLSQNVPLNFNTYLNYIDNYEKV